jgi:hypothetical protein
MAAIRDAAIGIAWVSPRGLRHETSEKAFFAFGSRRCRDPGRVAHRKGAILSDAACAHHRRISGGRRSTEIYAKAYNQSPEAVEFYEFTRTMQSYKSIISENTTLVLSTGSDLFKFLKGMTPDGDGITTPRSAEKK